MIVYTAEPASPIVQLAAAGLTNREIGQQLYLSPRTVSSHLYHAFPKLGVTSRAQLKDAIEGDGPGLCHSLNQQRTVI